MANVLERNQGVLMSEVKVFRVSGHYFMRRKKYSFSKDVRALKVEHALEEVLSVVSSQGMFRRQIRIDDVHEIQPEESQDYVIRYLSTDLK